MLRSTEKINNVKWMLNFTALRPAGYWSTLCAEPVVGTIAIRSENFPANKWTPGAGEVKFSVAAYLSVVSNIRLRLKVRYDRRGQAIARLSDCKYYSHDRTCYLFSC